MPSAKKVPEIDARALLDLAYDYAWAADSLFVVFCAENPSETSVINAPINFLYYHVAELCCKAVIKAMGELYGPSHNLSKLFAEATRLGLRVPDVDVVTEAKNVLDGMMSQNEGQAFRYFDGREGNSFDAAKVQTCLRRMIDATDLIVMKFAPERAKQPKRIRFVLPFQVLPWDGTVPKAPPTPKPVSPLVPRRQPPR